MKTICAAIGMAVLLTFSASADTLTLPKGQVLDFGDTVDVLDGSQTYFGKQMKDWAEHEAVEKESKPQAAAIGIIGGADSLASVYLTSKLAPHLLGAIAVAAYSYMSLVPLIQPPIMKMCTTKEQRKIKMVNLRPVSHFEKVLFPIVVAIVVSLLLPPVAALMGCLCMGNLFEVSGVTARLSDTAQNALINIVTIFLATGTGLTMSGDKFLRIQTIEIICLGLIAFAAGTAGGVLFGQIMRIASGNKINPLIGSAGVSAVPMAARVSQVVGLKDNPSNYLLMQAMGPNVAGVIGTAVAAGTMLAQFGG